MLSMGLTFPSSRNGAASATTTKVGYESPINGVVSDENVADDNDEEDDTDSTEDEEGTGPRVEISRPAMTQSRMQERFQFSRLPSPTAGCQNIKGEINSLIFGGVGKSSSDTKYASQCCLDTARSAFPVAEWLPKYRWRDDFVADFMAGLTVAVMHIPQGMAYAMLASVAPIVGLYTSFFPVLVYIMMGTSPHSSFGTFAVASIMISKPVEEFSKQTTSTDSTNVGEEEIHDPIEVATTLAFLIGILQVACGLLRLGSLVAILSEAMVSGFTTAAAVHVFSSQVKQVFGVSVPRRTGVFKLVKYYSSLFWAMDHDGVNWVSFGLCSAIIVVLFVYDLAIKDRLIKRLGGFIFPVQLFVVIVGTSISHGTDLKGVHNVSVVGEVTTGFPSPTPPNVYLFPALFMDAAVIAVVAYVISHSVGSVFAAKHGYEIRANQEFLAQGCSNVFGSFFSSLPMACSLSRSSVQESAGTRSMVATAVSVFVLLWVLLFAGPVFAETPLCVLAAIIIVSLKGIFLQFTHLPRLFRRSLSDGYVWLATFFATVMLDVHLGLIVGAVLNVLILLSVALNPIIEVTEETDFADLNLSPKYYQDVHSKEGFATLKLYGDLNFANAAKTQTAIEGTLKNLRSGCIGAPKNIAADEEDGIPSRRERQPTSKFFLILDVSGLSGIDSTGCNTLVNVRNKLRKTSVHLVLVGPSGPIIHKMDRCDVFCHIPKRLVFPTMQDAITLLKSRRQKEQQ